MNISGVHPISPEREGVRLAVKLTPHGPDQAVRSPLVLATQVSFAAAGASPTGTSAGCPMKARVMSGSGPWAVIIFGVWQSWQAPTTVR